MTQLDHDRVDLADKLRHEVSQLHPTPLKLGDLRPMETEKPEGNISDTTIVMPKAAFVCQTQASALCAPDQDDETKWHNYVFLRHSLRCTPERDVAIQNYKFAIRAIRESGAAGEPIFDLRDNGDRFEAIFSRSTLADTVLLTSLPGETPSVVGHSRTKTQTFDFNIGFFGKDPTVGFTHGWSISDSYNWNTPSVSCSDQSSENCVLKTFNMEHEQQNAAFEIEFGETFKLPAQGKDNDMRFEIGVAVTVKNGGSYANVTRQIFTVPQPPMP